MRLLFFSIVVAMVWGAVHGGNVSDAIPSTKAGKTDARCLEHVCFAIDGTSIIGRSGFELQKQFVGQVVKGIMAASKRGRVEFSGVQYGFQPEVISLKDNAAAFSKRLEAAKFLNASTRLAAGGVVFCHRNLIRGPRSSLVRSGSVMVFLGTGRITFGSDPIVLANAFRKSGGEVVSVALGETDEAVLRGVAGQPRNMVYLNAQGLQATASSVIKMICR